MKLKTCKRHTGSVVMKTNISSMYKENIFLLAGCWYSQVPEGPATAHSWGLAINVSSLNISQMGCTKPHKGFAGPNPINFRRNWMLQNFRDHQAFYSHFHAHDFLSFKGFGEKWQQKSTDLQLLLERTYHYKQQDMKFLCAF